MVLYSGYTEKLKNRFCLRKIESNSKRTQKNNVLFTGTTVDIKLLLKMSDAINTRVSFFLHTAELYFISFLGHASTNHKVAGTVIVCCQINAPENSCLL